MAAAAAAAATVGDLSASLHRFGAADYAVFAFMLVVCAAIGVYFGFFAGARTADEYLMGGRSMGTVPIALSLIASYISGITLLGMPTEIYLYGIQFMYIVFGIILMGIIMAYGFLPVFHDLKITSTYEYLHMRFGKEARVIGSGIFAIGILAWIPIVIYVPALAFNQATGVNVHVVTPIVCIVCIFYTCVGGLKAVVWTDVVQTVSMFGSMLLVIIKGTMDAGGLAVVWQRAADSGRIEAPNLAVDVLERHTLLVFLTGGCVHWLASGSVSQIMMQRYLALPTLANARLALLLFVLGALFLVITCGYSGLVIFATYYDCDPLSTKLAVAKDQLLPLLVMRTLGSIPGLPGCFVAGVFSAALSSMSTAMNSMAAVVLEDFYKTFCGGRPLTERQTDWLMKSVVVVVGVVCVALVFVVERLGSVLQLSMSLGGMANGPSLGIFTMGLFFPWIHTKGMIIGSCTGLAFMGWMVLGSQAALASGELFYPPLPLTTAGCDYEFGAPSVAHIAGMHGNARHGNATAAPENVMALYRVSYLWYTLLGCVVSVVVGLLASFALGANRPSDVDRHLLSPLVRRFVAPAPAPAADANGYKPVELQIISGVPGADDKEKEALKIVTNANDKEKEAMLES